MPGEMLKQRNFTISDIDPFSPEYIQNPYPFHEELREAGPIVWLRKYDVWCVPRYQEAQAVLQDWRTFCSGAGVGLANFKREKPWRTPSLLLEADPPNHTRCRTVMGRVLSPANLRALRGEFEKEAASLVTRVLDKPLDGVKDIAESYVMKVFPDAVGLTEEGRENIMAYGSMNFNSLGPRNEIFLNATANEQEVKDWVTLHCRRDYISTQGLAAQVYQAVDAGQLSEEEALLLVRSFFSAGIDTTVDSIVNALHCFANNPEQWSKVFQEPSVVRNALEEVLRYESPFQTFFRTATRDVEIAGAMIETDQKVMISVGSANRDPRRWQDPARFDIARRNVGQLSFGAGIHGCVGQMISRLEAEVLLTELARRVRRIELTGPAEPKIHNTLRGFSKLPVVLRST
jgi:4-methoxybenzoate monooxygenase (O-demethylating)